jgi:aerobic-type carbon monoxide dehydrogenase small subunit (CoxS/CutS family)
MPARLNVHLTVNGSSHALEVEPRRTLLETLREDLHLTGAKSGCDMGTCGACTVLVNGTALYSCLTLAVACDGAAVTTIEGLGEGDALDLVQRAFIEQDALQCGFCTPGQVLAMKALVASAPAALSDAEITRAMAGNLCRCGAYPKILAAGRALAGAGGQGA